MLTEVVKAIAVTLQSTAVTEGTIVWHDCCIPEDFLAAHNLGEGEAKVSCIMYLLASGRSTETGLQLGKACCVCSRNQMQTVSVKGGQVITNACVTEVNGYSTCLEENPKSGMFWKLSEFHRKSGKQGLEARFELLSPTIIVDCPSSSGILHKQLPGQQNATYLPENRLCGIAVLQEGACQARLQNDLTENLIAENAEEFEEIDNSRINSLRKRKPVNYFPRLCKRLTKYETQPEKNENDPQKGENDLLTVLDWYKDITRRLKESKEIHSQNTNYSEKKIYNKRIEFKKRCHSKIGRVKNRVLQKSFADNVYNLENLPKYSTFVDNNNNETDTEDLNHNEDKDIQNDSQKIGEFFHNLSIPDILEDFEIDTILQKRNGTVIQTLNRHSEAVHKCGEVIENSSCTEKEIVSDAHDELIVNSSVGKPISFGIDSKKSSSDIMVSGKEVVNMSLDTENAYQAKECMENSGEISVPEEKIIMEFGESQHQRVETACENALNGKLSEKEYLINLQRKGLRKLARVAYFPSRKSYKMMKPSNKKEVISALKRMANTVRATASKGQTPTLVSSIVIETAGMRKSGTKDIQSVENVQMQKCFEEEMSNYLSENVDKENSRASYSNDLCKNTTAYKNMFDQVRPFEHSIHPVSDYLGSHIDSDSQLLSCSENQAFCKNDKSYKPLHKKRCKQISSKNKRVKRNTNHRSMNTSFESSSNFIHSFSALNKVTGMELSHMITSGLETDSKKQLLNLRQSDMAQGWRALRKRSPVNYFPEKKKMKKIIKQTCRSEKGISTQDFSAVEKKGETLNADFIPSIADECFNDETRSSKTKKQTERFDNQPVVDCIGDTSVTDKIEADHNVTAELGLPDSPDEEKAANVHSALVGLYFAENIKDISCSKKLLINGPENYTNNSVESNHGVCRTPCNVSEDQVDVSSKSEVGETETNITYDLDLDNNNTLENNLEEVAVNSGDAYSHDEIVETENLSLFSFEGQRIEAGLQNEYACTYLKTISKKNNIEGIPELNQPSERSHAVEDIFDNSLAVKHRTIQDTCYPVGTVVWGRFSKARWWPAVVVEGKMLKKGTREGRSWIFWLSDNRVSELKDNHIELFTVRYQQRTSGKLTESMRIGILKALQICAERAELDLNSFQSIEEWGQSAEGFMQYTKDMKDRDQFPPDEATPLPSYILEQLGIITKNILADSSRVAASDSASDKNRGHVPDTIPVVIPQRRNKAKEKEADVDLTVCLSCDLPLKDDYQVYKHPVFEGMMCRKCKDVMMSSFYAIDDDGCSLFCVICGEGGKLFVCEKDLCGRAFCYECIGRLLGYKLLNQINQTNPWYCFLCSSYSALTHGCLIPRKDWQLEVVKFFQTDNIPLCNDLNYLTSETKRKIRVLSLFDGIGTGKLVLNELGLDVEVYYTSEINTDAILVSSYHHGATHIGDAILLTRAKLAKLCPIDLVLGGPPCNDLSIVNPLRKGFNGTGMLLMKFISILKDVEALCKGKNHVFWLLENTGSMLTDFKKVICSLLGMEPAVWDAIYFTGQRRARCFWGNIPGLYSTPEFCKQLQQEKKDLDHALISNCNRKALTSHMRTITCGTNSLTVRNGEDELPIEMNGVEDGIWVVELERLFGFPEHYTDVGHLSPSTRHRLLGKAWCVPVIKHILSPLKQYFALKDL